MRLIKLIGALAAVLAFSAIAVATASAVETLWKWLPGTSGAGGETLKGTSGEAILTTVDEGKTLVVKCTKSTLLLTAKEEEKEVHSEILENGGSLGLLINQFEGCKSLGLPANSVGAGKELILAHLETHNCMIKPGDFGVLFKLLPLTLEVPAAGVKILIRGSVIGLLEGKEGEKLLTFKLNLKAPGGTSQEIKLCEGGSEDKLEAALDPAGAFGTAFQEVKGGTLEFDMNVDKTGSEMMEK